jgi:hypothetical protein
MKNIHILPTDKLSRLGLHKNGALELHSSALTKNLPHYNPQHIYITSDEEIKEGDWCYYLNNLGGGNTVCQAYKHSEDKRMLFDNGNHNRKIGEGITPLSGECKKIILTTDQDLIKDGVQAIDDEFLEWFVKNPSCEEVEIENTCLEVRVCDCAMNENCLKPGYKIIIPQEKQKQHLIDIMRGDEELGLYEEPKQETLEERAARYNNIKLPIPYGYIGAANDFINGAKWQQERMYSKEESIQKIIDYVDFQFNTGGELNSEIKKWFEQFKKK